MHKNSLTIFKIINQDGSKDRRKAAILKHAVKAGKWLRDWDYLQAIFPGSDNLNKVRPRITELRDGGFLLEGPKMQGNYGTHPVRTTRINPDKLDLQTKLL